MAHSQAVKTSTHGTDPEDKRENASGRLQLSWLDEEKT
jgi:hypothetical protein